VDSRQVPPWVKHVWNELTRPPAFMQSDATKTGSNPRASVTYDEPVADHEAATYHSHSTATDTLRAARKQAHSAWQNVRDLFDSPTDPPTSIRTPQPSASTAERITQKYFVPKRSQRSPASKPRPRLKKQRRIKTTPSRANRPPVDTRTQAAAIDQISVTSHRRSSAEPLPLSVQNARERMRETLHCRIIETEAVDAVWRLTTDQGGVYALKSTTLPRGRIDFMAAALDEIQRRGFAHVAKIVRMRTGEPYFVEGSHLYVLSEWLPGARAQFGSTRQVGATARSTARLHEITRHYEPSGEKPPAAFAVFEHLLAQKQDLTHMQQQLAGSADTEDYDNLALRELTRVSSQASDALALLKLPECERQLAQSIADPGLCHLDVTRRNIIIHPSGHAQLIDFDHMTFGPRVLDLAHLIRRAMQAHGTWTSEIAIAPLLAYNRVRPLTQGEYLLLEALLTFPHRLWRVLRTHYEDSAKDKPAAHKAIEILRDTIAQDEERTRFLETFARQVTRRAQQN